MSKRPSIFLDSGNGWNGDVSAKDRYILFESPRYTLSFNDGITSITSDQNTVTYKKDPLYILEGYLKEGYAAAGYIGYEYSKYTGTGFEPTHKKQGEKLPQLLFNIYELQNKQVGDITHLGCGLTPQNQTIKSKIYNHPQVPAANMDQQYYEAMIDKAKRYIESGDIYQANLSQRFKTNPAISPFEYFIKLYEAQPVPYSSYMDFGEFQIISGSMELFIRKEKNKITTKPIKGTRRRGLNAELDTVKKAELISSDKERAENLMIVDLMRNDIGRICKPASVKVNSLFDIETYSTLHQMSSEIEGLLKEDADISDIIYNTFPPGSVTGAPKKRTLEVIDELEPHYRGPYCGALGIFYPDGDFVLSVGIRLLVHKDSEATFWVGGGIVWDSDPTKEYEETLLKSQAIKKAMGFTE